MRIPTATICIALAIGCLSMAGAQDRTRPAASNATLSLPSEQREASLAIAAKRRELGLPLGNAPLQPRDCSVEKTCANGTKVSCSASGKYTDCGGIYNGDGDLMGVGCFAFKTANPADGNVSVNQGTCG
jgi:hypothetical protein